MSGHSYTSSFVSELINGVHDLDTDEIKMALYTSISGVDSSITAYTTSNEVVGTGYTAGGMTMVVASGYPQSDGVGQSIRFEDVAWDSASFTTRCGLIYNASKANRSIMVLDFGGDRIAASATFAVRFPLSLDPLMRIHA